MGDVTLDLSYSERSILLHALDYAERHFREIEGMTMTEYEVKHETEAFQRGYWEAFLGSPARIRADDELANLDWLRTSKASERVDYARGYRAGRLDKQR